MAPDAAGEPVHVALDTDPQAVLSAILARLLSLN